MQKHIIHITDECTAATTELGDQSDRDTARIVGLTSTAASLKDRVKTAESSLAQCEAEKVRFRMDANHAATDTEFSAKNIEKLQGLVLEHQKDKSSAEQQFAEVVQHQQIQAAEHSAAFAEAASQHEAIVTAVQANHFVEQQKLTAELESTRHELNNQRAATSTKTAENSRIAAELRNTNLELTRIKHALASARLSQGNTQCSIPRARCVR